MSQFEETYIDPIRYNQKLVSWVRIHENNEFIPVITRGSWVSFGRGQNAQLVAKNSFSALAVAATGHDLATRMERHVGSTDNGMVLRAQTFPELASDLLEEQLTIHRFGRQALKFVGIVSENLVF